MRSEISGREVAPLEIQLGSFALAELPARLLHHVAEIDPGEARGAIADHMLQERSVTEPKLDDLLPSDSGSMGEKKERNCSWV